MGSMRAGSSGIGAACVAIAAVAAGCDRAGLYIRVETTASDATAMADTVRLYIGVPEEGDRAIAPEGIRDGEERYGNVWVRDPSNLHDEQAIARGGIAEFVFVDGAAQGEYGAVIAVGFTDGVPTSAGALFHVQHGADAVYEYELVLHPAATPLRDPDAENQVVVWGGSDGQSCVHVQNTRSDADAHHHHRTAFVVQPGDRDCDGFADEDYENECDSDVYQGSSPPSRSDLSCVTEVPADNGTVRCVLGGPACLDGPAVDTGCRESRYCAPPMLCALCGGADGWGCARSAPLQSASGPMIKCAVYALPIDNENYQLCAETITLPPLAVLANSAASCDRVHVISRSQTEFDAVLRNGAVSVGVTADASCALTLAPSGTMQLATTAVTTGLVALGLTSGRGLAVPIRIDVVPTPLDPGCYPPKCEVYFPDTEAIPTRACLATDPPY